MSAAGGVAGRRVDRKMREALDNAREALEVAVVTNEVLERRLQTSREKESLLLQQVIGLQGRVGELEDVLAEACGLDTELVVTELHFNPAAQLPPVDCPLLILTELGALPAIRTGYVASKGDQMEYAGLVYDSSQWQQTDARYYGRFEWTYP